MAYQNCDDYDSVVGEKATVECRALSTPTVGPVCAIVPYDHPQNRFNGLQCLTGKVISVAADGSSFETDKTTYKVV